MENLLLSRDQETLQYCEDMYETACLEKNLVAANYWLKWIESVKATIKNKKEENRKE